MKTPFEIALSQYGVRGIPGSKHSIDVLKYFVGSGFSYIKDDETAWCAAFASWCLIAAGIKVRGTLAARSFLNVGKPTDTPQLGDLVILWRIAKNGPYGHVGFFVRRTRSLVYILGGNQANEVNIKAFPVEQLLGYRTIPL